MRIPTTAESIGFAGFDDRLRYKIDPTKQGLHWVGDLMLEADVDVESASGELLLDLVEGGKHFRVRSI